jgi:hypothetical protein
MQQSWTQIQIFEDTFIATATNLILFKAGHVCLFPLPSTAEESSHCQKKKKKEGEEEVGKSYL